MSRTDKDMPWPIRATQFKPMHYYCEFDLRPYWWFWRPRKGNRSCDLPPGFARRHYRRQNTSQLRHEPHCVWEPVWDRRYYTKPPDHRDRRLYYWGPDRAKVRAFCHEARKNYHGSGSTSDLEPTEQHRHGPINGYWD